MIMPLAVDVVTGERQLIGAALVLAQNLDGQARRRLSRAIELGQPSFTCRHVTSPFFSACAGPAIPPASQSVKSQRRNEVGVWYHSRRARRQFGVKDANFGREDSMKARLAFLLAAVAPLTFASAELRAQDIPGIEICTAEKTMERRTSCLQSNVNFLQQTITKLHGDYQQRLDAANRQIEVLKAAAASLQKTVNDLQASQKQIADDLKKKADAPPAKEGTK
jgi:hypothetical protein